MSKKKQVDTRTAAYNLAIENNSANVFLKRCFSIHKDRIMKYGQIIIEEKEFLILENLFNLKKEEYSKTAKIYILKLLDELKRALILPESKMPEDVIRLNSKVKISSKDNLWVKTFELVLPHQSNVSDNKISLLLPMGTAVLGYAKGDDILWEFPSGLKELKVIDVKQLQKVLK